MLLRSLDGDLGAETLLQTNLNGGTSPRIELAGLRLLGLVAFGGLHRHDFLGAAYGQSLGDDARGQLFHIRFRRQSQQRTRMARGQQSGCDLLLHGGRQVEQSQGVGDLRTGFRHRLGQLGLRQAEIVDHLLVGSRLFQWIQRDAMQVFQQCVT